ncbi:MAG: beta-galactosidase trimerization domain-containing protein, partial [Spirochaetia bacterium]|nr:beta-galactosidase trimerization domain-containing protein [Spirochaetia bacterium]
DVAILSSESVKKGFVGARHDDHADEGAARILLEKQIPFDVIDTEDDFGKYKLLILPDHLSLDRDLSTKFKKFLSGGGKAILSGTSGMDPEHKAFAFDTSLKPLGESIWTNDYLQVSRKDFPRCVTSPFVTYAKAHKVQPGKGKILAEVWEPYFNRDYKHFCSHQHTPPVKKADYPGIVLEGSIAYFAHPIFSLYRRLGQPLYKELVATVLDMLLGDEAQVRTNLPSTARLSLMKKENEIHLHLLHAVPMKRGELPLWSKAPIEIIEDEIPLHGIEISLKLPKSVKRIKAVGIDEKSQEIPFTMEQGRIKLQVDEVKTHKMLVFEV